MNGILNLLIALVLVGDYLMLSASHVALGTKANWLLLIGTTQIAALILAVLLGRGRHLRVSIPMLGFVGVGLVMLAHSASHAVSSGDFADYGTMKTLTFFAVSGPAFLLGGIVGQAERLPGRAWAPLLIAPLALMCGLSLLTDPDLMTVRESESLEVFFGLLVLPVHQALAFSWGKIVLWLHATLQRPSLPRGHAIATVAVIGFGLGMSILSGSRGYLIAAVIALIVQWLATSMRLGFVLLATAVPMGLYAAISSETVRDGLDPTVIMSSASMQERLDLYDAAIEGFWARPFFGHGPGGFAQFYGWEERVYPHNIFLEILSETGLIGAICFAMIVIPVLARTCRAVRRGRLTEVQFFAVGFMAFAIVGTAGVADLIRNHFFFCAAGMTAVACTPRTAPEDRRAVTPGTRAPSSAGTPSSARPASSAT